MSKAQQAVLNLHRDVTSLLGLVRTWDEDRDRLLTEARELASKYHAYALSGTFPASVDEGLPWEKDND